MPNNDIINEKIVPTIDQDKSSTEDECEICQVSTSFSTYTNKTEISPSSYRHNGNNRQTTYIKCEQTRLNSTIILAIIAGISAIILASSIQQILQPSTNDMTTHFTQLMQRIDKLENDNIAMRLEISRLVDLVYRKPTDTAGNGNVNNDKSKQQPQRNNHEKRVWLGDGPLDQTITLDANGKKSSKCHEQQPFTDDLFSDYNAKKCQQHGDAKDSSRDFQNFAKKAEKDFGFPFVMDEKQIFDSLSSRNRTREFNVNDQKSKKQYSKNERKLRKYKENYITKDKFEPTVVGKENNDEQKQQEEQKQQQNEKKRKFSNIDNSLHTLTDDDSDWYGKMMKNREDLRQQDQKWYLNRANERERQRTKSNKNPPKEKRWQRL